MATLPFIFSLILYYAAMDYIKIDLNMLYAPNLTKYHSIWISKEMLKMHVLKNYIFGDYFI